MNKEVEEAKRTFNSYIHAIETFGTIDYKCINNLYNPAIILLNYIQELEESIHKERISAEAQTTYEVNEMWKQKITDEIEECKSSILEIGDDENYYIDAIHHNQLVLFAQEILQELLNEEE